VSAVASGYEVTLCWLGDSRAYWLGQPAEESRLLTHDDSVAGGMIAAGLVDDGQRQWPSPHAHVLTRWLGGEAADLADDPERAPHVERFTPPGAGSLLICSDGLWNYLTESADLARLALPKALTDPLGAATDMVKFAVDAGGGRQHHGGPDPLPRPRDTLDRPCPPLASAAEACWRFPRPARRFPFGPGRRMATLSIWARRTRRAAPLPSRRATDMTFGRE